MYFINTKEIFSFAALLAMLSFANLSHSMEGVNQEHKLPTLHVDFQKVKAIFKISAPPAWRSSNSYLKNKTAIEQAIINEPEKTVQYGVKRFSSIVLSPLENNLFDLKKVEEFFRPTEPENFIGNHYALMKECRVSWCPLSRSSDNHKRKDFEDALVEYIKTQHNIDIPIRYVGFGSAISLFGDLRMIMMLKKAGYKFEKIQFIDPVVEPFINGFIKSNINEIGAGSLELPMTGNSLPDYFKNNKARFEDVKAAYVIAQFLAILSNYDGDEVVEYYLNVNDYISDNPNSQNKAHVVVALDLLDPKSVLGLTVSPVKEDLNKLKTHNNGAIGGFLYADYTDEENISKFVYKTRLYYYDINSTVSVINVKGSSLELTI